MVRLQHIQLGYLHIQIALFDNQRVAGGKGFDFRIAQCGFIHIIRNTGWGLAGHNLGDKLLLVLHQLIKVGIKSIFRHIAIDFHLRILVALTDDSA